MHPSACQLYGQVTAAAKEMAIRGLACGSSSNISLRRGQFVFNPPAGIPYSELRPLQIVVIDLFTIVCAAVLQELPLINDEGRLLFGKSIPVSHYAPPGTWELAQAVAKALRKEGKATLIARHGTRTVGTTPREALALAEKVEEMARLFWLVH